jgi:hypothetical protein
VTGITLHIAQISSNRLTFTSGGANANFSLLSSDGDFSSVGPNTIQGKAPAPGDDANGSLFFAGSYSELSWTSSSSVTADGLILQLSVNAAPEPSSVLLFTAGLAGLFGFRLRGRT